MTTFKIKVLGSGTSTGVPILGCSCDVCQSNDPKNIRSRPSLFLESPQGNRILVDIGPDFRAQLLREQINNFDSIIITHEHADHTQGLDDLRSLCFIHDKTFPVYTTPQTIKEFQQRFHYIFKPQSQYKNTVSRIELNSCGDFESFEIEGFEFTFFYLAHGHTQSLGFYVRGIAYLLDCGEIPLKVIQFLQKKNLNLLFIDCATRGSSPSHLNLKQSLSYIDQIPALSYRLMHLNHHFDHETLCNELKENYPRVQPAYDGEQFLLP